jgi:hypothetical protein
MILSRWPDSSSCIVLFRYCFETNKWATVGHFVSIRKRTILNQENLNTDNTDLHGLK